MASTPAAAYRIVAVHRAISSSASARNVDLSNQTCLLTVLIPVDWPPEGLIRWTAAVLAFLHPTGSATNQSKSPPQTG